MEDMDSIADRLINEVIGTHIVVDSARFMRHRRRLNCSGRA